MKDSPENDGSSAFGAKLGAAFSVRGNLRALVHEPVGAFGSLDGVRALAALWVLTFHAVTIPLLAPITANAIAPYARSPIFRVVFAGHLSVDIFLVLAGFLMTHLLLRERTGSGSIDFLRFVRRRWLRIVPLYAAMIALYMADDRVQLASCARWGWSNLLFVNNFVSPQLKPDSCLGHGWSLAVEFQLYLVTPFLVGAAYARRSRLWLTLVLGLVVVAGIVLWFDVHPAPGWYDTVLYDKPYARSTPYVAGMLAAFAASQPRNRSRASTWADVLALVIAVGLVFTPRDWVDVGSRMHLPLLIFGRPLFGAAIAYLVFRMVTGNVRVLARMLSWRGWLPVARLSYGAYLVQFVCVPPVLRLWAATLIATRSYASMLLVLTAQTLTVMGFTLVLALVGYLLVEKPFMNLRER